MAAEFPWRTYDPVSYTPAMPMEAPARHRLLLSLRSEAAMGLRSVRASFVEPSQGTVSVDEAGRLPEIEEEQPPVAVSRRTPLREVELFAPTGVTTAPVKSAPRVLPSIELPLMSTKEKTAALSVMNENEVSVCKKCRLCETRTQTVFGEGDVDAKNLFHR